MTDVPAMSQPDIDFMQAAIAQARSAEMEGEVPIGAVIVREGRILASGNNRVLRDNDPSAHAEVVALRAAGKLLGNYRLDGCDLYTTLEPCAMCAGAIIHARVQRLIYGADDPKAGACGSVLGVLNHPRLNHRLEVVSGVLADESTLLLQNFFRARR
jgi:tRNA(adenine34) deaminase